MSVMSPELLIVESDVSEVYGTEYDRIYTVKSKLFPGEHIARAYTSNMVVKNGFVEFDVLKKTGFVRRVRKPFHFIMDDMLCVLKNNKHLARDSFGLNHELFALDWRFVVVLHFFNEEPCFFIVSRDLWLKEGFVGQENEELQVFYSIPDHCRLPVSAGPALAQGWIMECLGC